jgi:hypothetical protein
MGVRVVSLLINFEEDIATRVLVDNSSTAWLLGLALQKSDPPREADSFLKRFGFRLFSLPFVTSESQD